MFFLSSNADDFLHSYITHYGCATNARDTHDYHPFILKKTQQSFYDLESHIVDKGFTVAHRMVICGYQQDAVPSYYTHGVDTVIDDEVSVKTSAGWNFSDGNLFGFATGFLLKDLNCVLQKKGFVFEHVAPGRVGLFDDRAYVFQKHAFGDVFPVIAQLRTPLYRHIVSGDCRKVLSLLNRFWRFMYDNQMCDGARNRIATQDSLFSMYYANYLINSQTPIKKFFVGPDITYPIELLSCQNQHMTQGAQECVQKVVDYLKPVDDKKTAYIFCSFVDGVGKSTLLGNVKNYIQFGTQYAQYERVDNSSSLTATLFAVSDDVCIVDLPAQVSHYLPKPDGSVFVDVRTAKKYSDTYINSVKKYAHNNKDTLIVSFKDCMAEFKKSKIVWSGDDSVFDLYVKNCCLFDVDASDWLPFYYDEDLFLMHVQSGQLRVLVPFSGVHSMGLKVVQPEQMIFSKGISVPMNSDHFLHNLTDQMATFGVENIVFVDFMSMYPRTSRENIRVNFLLQQLRYHFGTLFCPDYSFYTDFVTPYDVYLLYKNHGKQVMNAFFLDAGVRYSLYRIIKNAKKAGMKTIDLHIISDAIAAEYLYVYNNHCAGMDDLIVQKIMDEYQLLADQYALDKECEVFVQFDFSPLINFSLFLHKLFTKNIHNTYFNALWNGLGSPIDKTLTESTALLENGIIVDVLGVYSANCRDKIELHKICSLIRVHWYASLSNIVSWKVSGSGIFTADDVSVAVPPLLIKQYDKDHVCVVRRHLDAVNSGDKKLPKLFFKHAQKKTRSWGTFLGKDHCVDWTGISTGQGVYAFGCSAYGTSGSFVNTVVQEYYDYYQKQGRKNIFIPTSFVWNHVKKGQKKSNNTQKQYYYDALQLFVRAVATLDMIIKDPAADIMTRRGNNDDFIATMHLLEMATLPDYFNVHIQKNLFNNYESVCPVV